MIPVTDVTSDEVRRYIDKCRELADDGEYAWWSRLAEILSALSDGVKRPLIVPIPKSEPPLEGAFVFPAENVL